ncbi:MAG: hypothetical protein J6B81_05710 [Spirochaetaceae bacterium]|nr:hypothetical protein [Spirochaetaceae bacterium]
MPQNVKSFNITNISQILDFVKPMWTFSGWEDSFRNIYAETILRNNYFENDFAFQIMEGNRLCSAMFLQRPYDKNNFEQWFSETSANFDEEEKERLKLCAEYLSLMDSKVHHLMNNDDIKLSLFVGLQKGSGKILYEEVWQLLKSSGYKNMYLWTDCECNWQWYIKNGFTLLEESTYKKFNDENKLFETYIFKKQIV